MSESPYHDGESPTSPPNRSKYSPPPYSYPVPNYNYGESPHSGESPVYHPPHNKYNTPSEPPAPVVDKKIVPKDNEDSKKNEEEKDFISHYEKKTRSRYKL